MGRISNVGVAAVIGVFAVTLSVLSTRSVMKEMVSSLELAETAGESVINDKGEIQEMVNSLELAETADESVINDKGEIQELELAENGDESVTDAETIKKLRAAMTDPDSTALLIIDVQDCFLPGGDLAVDGSDKIIAKINAMRAVGDDKLWTTVALSQDYHPAGHISFASAHAAKPFVSEMLTCVDPKGAKMTAILKRLNKKRPLDEDAASCCPDYAVVGATDPMATERLAATSGRYDAARADKNHACKACKGGGEGCIPAPQDLWPDHCVQGTEKVGFSEILTRQVETDIVVRKGTNLDVDSYSAFANNTNAVQTDLHDILQGKKPVTTATDHAAKEPELSTAGLVLRTPIKTVLVTGIAEDVCVKFTAKHALSKNYQVILVKDAAKGLTEPKEDEAESELATMNVIVVSTKDVVDLAKSWKHRAAVAAKRLIQRLHKK